MSRCSLIGRERELESLSDAVKAAGKGLGGCQVVVGEAGVGKTRLVRDVAAMAGTDGLRLLWGAASPSSSPMPWRPLVAVSNGAMRMFPADAAGAPALPSTVTRFAAVLAHLAPTVADVAASQDVNCAVMAEGLLALLEAIGDDPPVVVFEDLHWADADSLAVIEYMAERAVERGLLLVVTARTEETRQTAHALRRLEGVPGAVRHELRRLSDRQTARMVGECLGAPSDDPSLQAVIEYVARAADGLPLLVEGILETAVRDGVVVFDSGSWHVGDSDALAVPLTFADTVARRLGTLDPGARRILSAASLFGASFPWSVLGEVVGCDGDEVLAALRSAIDAGLIVATSDGFAFRHALTARAVVDAMVAPERRALAAAAALSLESADRPFAEDRADTLTDLHVLAGDLGRAVDVLAAAGCRALAAGAVQVAIDAIRRAADLAGGLACVPVQARLAFLAALVAGGDVEEACRVGHALVDHDAGRQTSATVDVHLMLARALVRAEPARATQEVAAARIAAGDDAVLKAKVGAVDALVVLESDTVDRIAAAENLARVASQAAEAAGCPEVACEALEVLGRAVRMHDLPSAAEVFARQLLLAETSDLTLWRIRALHELGTIDTLRWLDTRRMNEATAAAWRAGALTLASGYSINVAAGHMQRGEYDEAVAAAVDCENTAQQFGLTALAATAVMFQAAIAAHRGRRAEMERLLSRLTSRDRGDLAVAEWGFCRAMLAVVEDNRPAALEACAQADLAARRAPALMGNISGRLWLLLRLVDGSADPSETGDERPDDFDVRWDQMHVGFVQAVARGRSGRHQAAGAMLERALEAAAPYPLHRHLYLRLTAEAAIADGWGTPVVWLVEVEAWAIGHGYPAVTAACRALLRRVGVVTGRRGPREGDLPNALRERGVTARELDVLRLVATRQSNREIADRLYLSPRTVEKHVAALLAKLNAASRMELGARAVANGWVLPMPVEP
jgi:DNA-binding CsgD family transcriptional regulator